MDAGKFNRRITIQQPTVGRGTSGGRTTAWAEWKKVWAKVTPLSGNERRSTDHGGEKSEARTEFIIRYRLGITEEMRIQYKGKNYNIKHVKDVNDEHDIMVLTCDTGMNDG
ncbi:phage head closure protein [Noviherbaspirillum saxi]|uniref:Head-tail adaptor protein n=1 Tax=Noviherbaspirillum saxi TaxID=2320863 RepID=A0A3A3FWK9_9BURK|nr:phage head closure protein [Noviherbaspirillum saxi]RJF99018.1 head-tail adaptor protein [Noviherbaspirillum saxi]